MWVPGSGRKVVVRRRARNARSVLVVVLRTWLQIAGATVVVDPVDTTSEGGCTTDLRRAERHLRAVSVSQFFEHLPPGVAEDRRRPSRVVLARPRQMNDRPALLLREPVQDFLTQLASGHRPNVTTFQHMSFGYFALQLTFQFTTLLRAEDDSPEV